MDIITSCDSSKEKVIGIIRKGQDIKTGENYFDIITKYLAGQSLKDVSN